jgi:hypothetical protein
MTSLRDRISLFPFSGSCRPASRSRQPKTTRSPASLGVRRQSFSFGLPMTRTNERPVVVGCDRGMLRFSVARQVGFAPTRWSGITELTIIIAASLILASAHASPTQLAIPTEEQQQTTQQFDSFATCIAYWRVVGQCLPPGMTQKIKRCFASRLTGFSPQLNSTSESSGKVHDFRLFPSRRLSIAGPVRYSLRSEAVAGTWRARFETTATNVRRHSKALQSGRKNEFDRALPRGAGISLSRLTEPRHHLLTERALSHGASFA